jgi:hypothetical protein
MRTRALLFSPPLGFPQARYRSWLLGRLTFRLPRLAFFLIIIDKALHWTTPQEMQLQSTSCEMEHLLFKQFERWTCHSCP